MDARDRLKNITYETGVMFLNPRFIGPCLAGLFCLIVATVIGISYLFTMATILLALPIASYVIGMIILRGCSVTRDKVLIAEQGRPGAVEVRVKSSRMHPPRGLLLRDHLPRLVHAEEKCGALPPVGKEAKVSIGFVARKRGRYRLGPIEASCWDPLGMLHLRGRLAGTTELIVYPREVPFRVGRLLSPGRDADSIYPSGRLAPSGEFAGIREYRHGDELRRIHWKTTARAQRLTVKELEDTSVGSVTVILDTYSGSDFGRGPVTALDVAAGAVAYAVKQYIDMGMTVRMMLMNGETMISVKLRSPKDLAEAMIALADAKSDSPTAAEDLLRVCGRKEAVLLVTCGGGGRLVDAVRNATMHGGRIMIGLVDLQPFDKLKPIAPCIDSLERAGACVEVIREVGAR